MLTNTMSLCSLIRLSHTFLALRPCCECSTILVVPNTKLVLGGIKTNAVGGSQYRSRVSWDVAYRPASVLVVQSIFANTIESQTQATATQATQAGYGHAGMLRLRRQATATQVCYSYVGRLQLGRQATATQAIATQATAIQPLNKTYYLMQGDKLL